jgi:two-component system response regulator DevR
MALRPVVRIGWVLYNGFMPTSTYGRQVKVYLLDDHDIVRQGLRDLLAPARDVLVVGDSGLAQTAPAAIVRLGAEVMVLDLQLQDGSGAHVCRQVRSTDPSIQGLLVTSADDDDALTAAVLAGASGFVVKLARSSNILGAIRDLKAGRTLIDETLTERASRILRARVEALHPRPTEHDRELLEHILAGRTDREIADHSGLDVAVTQEQVTVLIDRLMSPARQAAPADGDVTLSGGRHRRTI